MKKTQIIDLLTTIKGTLVSFVSITMFVLLGVGLFLGIHWVSGSVNTMADKAFEQGRAHDVQIVFPYGLTDADLAQLGEVQGVSGVEGGYFCFLRGNAQGKPAVLAVHSLPQSIDGFISVEGKLPEAPGEVAADAKWARDHDVGLGDTLTLDNSGKDSNGVVYLKTDTFRVTALVSSPAYLCARAGTYGLCGIGTGTVDGAVWLTDGSFDPAAFQDAKPLVLVHSQELEGLASESQDYREKVTALKDRISELGTKLGNERYQDLYRQGKNKLDEGARAIAEGQSQISAGRTRLEQEVADAQRQFDEATAQMADGEAQIAAAERQLSASEQELNYYQGLFEQAQELYAQARDSIAELRAGVEELRAELQGGTMTTEEYQRRVDELCADVEELLLSLGVDLGFHVDHTTVDQLLDGASETLDELRTKEFSVGGFTISLETAPSVLAQAREKWEGAQAEMEAKRQQIADGRVLLEEKRAQLAEKVAEAEKKLADSQAQLDEKTGELAEGEQKLASMRAYEWNVTSRTESPSYIGIDLTTSVMMNLRWSMASLFLIVGLLVCYSAVSRIVHEQATRIGTKKALGFRRREVTALFLAYSGLAVVLGVLLSLVLAIVVVEGLLLNTLTTYFNARPEVFLNVPDVLLLAAVEFVLIGGATWLAVRGVLSRQAVELLAGERPASAKTRFFEKWGVWKRMGLLAQTTVNNCINERRRVVATLVGVAGCTALIVTAVTLYLNLTGSLTRTYDAVMHYDTLVYPDGEAPGAAAAIDEALGKAGVKALPALRRTLFFEQPDGITTSVTITVPTGSGDLSELITTLPVGDAWGSEGILLSQAMHEHLGINVGDEVKLKDAIGQTHSFPVKGFYEFHLMSNQAVIDKALYEQSFGTAEPNVVLAQAGGGGAQAVSDALKGVKGVALVYDDYKLQAQVFTEFARLTTIVVIVYLCLAAVMALVVLLNLDVMFINEKKRELIVLMINGYSVRQAKGYIWHDAVVLTLLGIVLGCVLGVVTGGYSVSSVEISMSSYLHDICWPAIGAGVAGTILFAGGVLVWALRLIEKFDLTDISRF